MNKIITLCLLIICVIVTGCGNAAGSGSLNNTPVIYNVTPNDSSSIANSVDSNGNVTVTLTGTNFGSRNENSRVYYNGYTNESSTTPQRTALSFVNGGTWTENQVSVILYKHTREDFPYGTFSIVANGHESPATAKYNFGGGNLKNASVSDVSPKTIYEYDNSSKNIVITGTGFGKDSKPLELFDMSNPSNYITVNPYIWTDTNITFTFPTTDKFSNSTNIGIKDTQNGYILGNSNLSQFRYEVFNPTISSISPSYAYPGQSVTIYSYNGGFGSERPSSVYLNINNNPVSNITSWSDSSITFVIPEYNSFEAGPATINLQMNNKTITNGNVLFTLVPHIKNVTVYKDSVLLSSTYTYTVTGYCLAPNTSLFIDNTLSSDISIKSSSASTLIFSSSKDLAGRNLYMTTNNSTITSNYYLLPSASN